MANYLLKFIIIKNSYGYFFTRNNQEIVDKKRTRMYFFLKTFSQADTFLLVQKTHYEIDVHYFFYLFHENYYHHISNLIEKKNLSWLYVCMCETKTNPILRLNIGIMSRITFCNVYLSFIWLMRKSYSPSSIM